MIEDKVAHHSVVIKRRNKTMILTFKKLEAAWEYGVSSIYYYTKPMNNLELDDPIGYVNEYPTMHYFGIPRDTQSMIAYKILTEYFWKFQSKFALREFC